MAAPRLVRVLRALLAEPLAAGAEAALDRWRAVVLLALAGAWLTVTMASAQRKPFWHDEVVTIVLSRLPSCGRVWTATRDGADLAPPLNTLVTRVVHETVGVGPVSTRIAAMAGTLLMVGLLFAFVRRRAGTSLGAAAVVLVSCTAAFRYGYEARGYGLLLGFFMLALYSWSEAAGGRHRRLFLPLLTIALVGACWSHYFGAFALAPVAAGEIVRAIGRRRPDAGVCTAAAVSVACCVPLLVLVRSAAAQSAHFWGRAADVGVAAAYAFVLHELLGPLVAGAALLALVIAVAGRWTRARADGRGMPAHEIAAVAACLLLPVIEIAAASAVGGAFVPRYALPASIGAALAMPLAVWYLSRGATLARLAFALVLVAGFAATSAESLIRPGAEPASPADTRPVLMSALRGPRPVAVTGGLMFLQLWYYSPPALRGRLWFLADPREAAAFTGSDTIDRGLLALARWAPLNVADYPGFTSTHPEFGVYAAGSGWLLDRLIRDAWELESAAAEPGGQLFVAKRVGVSGSGSGAGTPSAPDARRMSAAPSELF
ncbi:MAG TPA: glycosyltransferase family 39 protein [Vicinamibacterales bacterium]|nr:glycosyltransferase family 39 protein [Vicinamibacterales bacterium]